MTIAIFIIVGATIVGLLVILQRRSSGADPLPRDVDRLDRTSKGPHQGRSPGADGGGHSYYTGG